MKLWLKLATFLSCLVILAACGSDSPEKVVKKVEKAWGNYEGYTLFANMEMQASNQSKQYDIEVWHTKPDLYRVEVTEAESEARQIIVKNDDGVFIVAPDLNKTYEFQSDWPEKNSQAYFIHTLLNDLKADADRKMTQTDKAYTFEIAAQNHDKTGLSKQKIEIDKETFAPSNVTLFNEAGDEKIKIHFQKVNFKEIHKAKEYTIEVAANEAADTEKDSASKDEADVENSDTSSNDAANSEQNKPSSNETTYYPTHEFANTKLAEEKVIMDGDRVRTILTYEGDKRFAIMQEATSKNEEMVPVFAAGDIAHIGGKFSSMTENSLTWEESGKSFFLASNDLSIGEMIEVANSMTEDSLK